MRAGRCTGPRRPTPQEHFLLSYHGEAPVHDVREETEPDDTQHAALDHDACRLSCPDGLLTAALKRGGYRPEAFAGPPSAASAIQGTVRN